MHVPVDGHGKQRHLHCIKIKIAVGAEIPFWGKAKAACKVHT